MTKFQDCIADEEVFRFLLEGFLARWDGIFDVLITDPYPAYLYKPRRGDTGFCKVIRATPAGDALCFRCDVEHAELVRKTKQPTSYLCHAGLVDIAVPIIVDNELVATILCGQCRSDDPEQDEKGELLTRSAANRLSMDTEPLLRLRGITRRVTGDEIEQVKERLCKVATWTAVTGHERLELQKTRKEFVRESQHIQSVLATLTTVEIMDFWGKLDSALERITETIGADQAALFVGSDAERAETYRFRSSAGLNRAVFQETYPSEDVFASTASGNKTPRVVDFSMSPLSFNADLVRLTGRVPEKVLQIPFRLSQEHQAVMLFFLSSERDLASSLPIEREVDLLSQVAPQFATAYENCLLYTRQKELAKEKDIFLEDIAHQIITPLSGIQADCDRLWRHLSDWDSNRILGQVYRLRGMSRCAAHLARNLVWEATRAGHALLKTEPIQPTKLLIGCAIDVQGQAFYKQIRVHVDPDSTDKLHQLSLDRLRITQVLVNLLDNAVKYADKGTEVVVSGVERDGWVYISVSDHGIPLQPDLVEKVFERGFRSEEAQQKVPGGTGIGLSVAREIARLHGGDLMAEPSIYDPAFEKHKVVFTLRLPAPPQEVPA